MPCKKDLKTINQDKLTCYKMLYNIDPTNRVIERTLYEMILQGMRYTLRTLYKSRGLYDMGEAVHTYSITASNRLMERIDRRGLTYTIHSWPQLFKHELKHVMYERSDVRHARHTEALPKKDTLHSVDDGLSEIYTVESIFYSFNFPEQSIDEITNAKDILEAILLLSKHESRQAIEDNLLVIKRLITVGGSN